MRVSPLVPMVPLYSYLVKNEMVTMVPEVIKMSEKRTAQIAVRITPETKKILQQEADKLDWTVSKLAERILREWTTEAKERKSGSVQFIIQHNENINL